jgi:hypothetical protein
MQRESRRDTPLDRALRIALSTRREFVHFGRKEKHGPAAREIAGQESDVELVDSMARIDHQDEPYKRLAGREVAREERLPVALQRLGHRRIAVARQVGNECPTAQPEEVDLLRAAGVLLVNASRVRLASTLIALDLPALDRPANAISGVVGGGSCSSFATPATNSAC